MALELRAIAARRQNSAAGDHRLDAVREMLADDLATPPSLSEIARRLGLHPSQFGPRGLASIIFADLLLAHSLPQVGLIRTIVNVTVVSSVLVHGATAWEGSERYASWFERHAAADPAIMEAGKVRHLATRHRSHQLL
jgi:hypothetical protein